MRFSLIAAGLMLAGCSAITGASDLVTSTASTSNDDAFDGGESTTVTAPTHSTPAPAVDAGTVDASDAGTTTTTTSSVACGGATCTGATPVCCTSANGSAETCGAVGSCGSRFELGCDDNADCATGTVCCVHANAGVASCSAAAACADPNSGIGEYCNGGANQCTICNGPVVTGPDNFGFCSN